MFACVFVLFGVFFFACICLFRYFAFLCLGLLGFSFAFSVFGSLSCFFCLLDCFSSSPACLPARPPVFVFLFFCLLGFIGCLVCRAKVSYGSNKEGGGGGAGKKKAGAGAKKGAAGGDAGGDEDGEMGWVRV